MNRALAALPLVAFLGLALLFGLYGLKHDPHVAPDALVGQPVPALTLAKLETGEPIALRARAKGPALINFFASWCAPCIEEAPALMALKDAGVRIIGLDYKDSPAAVRAFISRSGDPYEVVLSDPDGAAGIEFGASGFPETFVVNGRGVIVAKYAGPLTPEIADRLLAKAQTP